MWDMTHLSLLNGTIVLLIDATSANFCPSLSLSSMMQPHATNLATSQLPGIACSYLQESTMTSRAPSGNNLSIAWRLSLSSAINCSASSTITVKSSNSIDELSSKIPIRSSISLPGETIIISGSESDSICLNLSGASSVSMGINTTAPCPTFSLIGELSTNKLLDTFNAWIVNTKSGRNGPSGMASPILASCRDVVAKSLLCFVAARICSSKIFDVWQANRSNEP